MKPLIICLLAMTCLTFTRGADETASGQTTGQSETEEIASYFSEQKMQRGMGSIMLYPVLGQDSSVRAALIKHQDEFDSNQARTIFLDANIREKRAFLPLIRREVAAPDYDPDALPLLSEFEPDEARPLIVADLQRTRPLFRNKKTYRNFYPYCYLHLPDRPIPELTAYFHLQLQHPRENFDYEILLLVDRYGTSDLLPDVLSFYKPHAGTWACKTEVSCLRFWIRWDRPAGLAALATSRKSRLTGCYRSLLWDVSAGRWNIDMQNLALEDLNDPDVDVVNAAINGLEHLGDASVAEPVVSAYTKLVGLAANDPKIAKAIAAWWSNPSSGARILMDNERFHLNDEQRRKLEAIARLQP